ncbi:MAG TPA: DUF1501 domain-containing protein, partial [Pirellulaceae bacterium]|nr:DUF1501 domain-containing protein [Pirellulaceae bacterium]
MSTDLMKYDGTPRPSSTNAYKDRRPRREVVRAQPISRRDMLRHVGGGFGMLGLTGALAQRSAAATLAPHFAPRAKRVIFLFMSGGPSQVDTFDPKPMLAKLA